MAEHMGKIHPHQDTLRCNKAKTVYIVIGMFSASQDIYMWLCFGMVRCQKFLPISFKVTSLALGQSYASKVSLNIMARWITQILQEL